MSEAAIQDRPAGGDALRSWRHLTILETIGEDAAATVYRAHDRTRLGKVALKLMQPAANESIRAKALDEARLRMRVRHPGVATVWGSGEADGRIGLWMELVKGETLADILRTKGPLRPREAARIGLALCGALAAVHDAGLLYGDVRAHQVKRVESDGKSDRVVLLNFGMEPALAESGPSDVADGSALLYQPPEVLAGRPRTPAADIYGLGVLLFHLVTNAYPVNGRTREEIERAHHGGERLPLRDARARLPKEFVQAVERLLAPNPLDRFQTLGAVEVTLARYVGPESGRRWRNVSWRRVAAGVAVLALAGAAGLVYRTARVRRNTPTPPLAVKTMAAATDAAAGQSSLPYTINAALYRESGERGRLQSSAQVAPGDELSIEMLPSVALHAYIVRENERGETDLLYPLPGQQVANPLPAGIFSRLPATKASGEREHLLIFASPERMAAFEQSLPRLDPGQPAARTRLPEAAINLLRAIGRTTPTTPAASGSASLAAQFPSPPGERLETVRGVWVRQVTLEKPVR